MTSVDGMRASDSDREKVVQALQEQVGEGRLTLAEFEQRSTEAYATAKTVGDLRALTKDLPVDPLAPPAAVKPPLASWQQPWPLPENPSWAQQQRYSDPDNPYSQLSRRYANLARSYARVYPGRTPGGGPPVTRRVHPVRIAAGAILVLWVIGGIFAAVAHVFPWPLLIIAFFLLAGGSRRRRYR